MDIREVQRRLAAAGLYGGAIDGLHGPRTRAAIEALFLARPVVQGDWRRWGAARHAIAAAQLFCLLDGIEVGAIDGLKGPQTQYAFEVYAARLRGIEGVENWRDNDEPPPTGHDLARKATAWPRQSDCLKFFGPVGANQALLAVPRGFGMVLAWNPAKPVTRFSCHEKIHDPVNRVLARALDHYRQEGVRALRLNLFGGCLNVRRMRGGSAWSMHAWGIALDFDPECNQLTWDRTRARFAQPEYETWWALWEEEGFVSLGRARDFDWMHVQAARV